jgi:hypothetical protein
MITRRILLIVSTVVLSSSLFGQCSHFPKTPVNNGTGVPVPSPSVRVCSEPASGLNCTPLVNLFSDAACSQAISNPMTGDSQGNIDFYTNNAPVRVHLQINGLGISQVDVAYVSLLDNLSGTIGVTVVPSTAPANQFATGISGTGVISYAQPGAANLSNGTTGSGLVVLQTSPSLITPVLGAATGTSLNLGATGVLSTTAQSGTGSICMTTNCVMTTPNIGAAIGTSLNLGATGVLGTTAQSGTGSLCMTTNCVMTTPNIGAATGTSLNLSGSMTAGSVTDNGTFAVTGTSTLAAVTATSMASSGAVSGTTGTFSGATTTQSINSELEIGGAPGQFSTIQACLNQCNSNGGGSCRAPANYTETLSANIVLKPSCVLKLPNLYTITMGSNQVFCAAGTCNGAGIIADAPPLNGTNGFIYTGTGKAFAIGDSSAGTTDIVLNNVKIIINTAGTNASGIYLTRVQKYSMHMPAVVGSGAANNQLGIVLDGSGTFTGAGTIIEPDVEALGTGIQGTGSGVNAPNGNRIIGGFASSSDKTCIDFEAGSSGNIVLGFDCENSTGPAVKMGNTANGNRVSIWNASNNSDFNFGASTFNNSLDCLTSPCVAGVDSGNNFISRPNNPVVAGDFSLTPGGTCNGITQGSWGATSTVSTVLGTDSSGLIQITTSGNGETANPCIQFTYHDGPFTTPGAIATWTRSDTNAPLNIIPVCTTGNTITKCAFMGTPINGNVYQFNWITTRRNP